MVRDDVTWGGCGHYVVCVGAGQLGTGAQEECQATPLLVHLPLGVAVKKLVCGPDCSLLITHKLTVYATGSNK